jgi:hypothetical protein
VRGEMKGRIHWRAGLGALALSIVVYGAFIYLVFIEPRDFVEESNLRIFLYTAAIVCPILFVVGIIQKFQGK